MDLYIDNQNSYFDIEFEDGRLRVVDGIDEIKNRVIVNLSTYVGENYRDTTHGVDYYNNVFGHSVDDIITQDELKAAILDTLGVTGMTSFSLVKDGRTAILTAQAKTTLGELNLVTEITL